MKNKSTLLKIIASPFVLGLMLITYNYSCIKRWLLFLKYGGEFIDYEKDDLITIHEIYHKLKENEKKNNPKPRKSILYKNPEDIIVSVDIKQEKGIIQLDFSADCGKHGTDEAIDGYKLTAERLLKILQDRDDYTDDEL